MESLLNKCNHDQIEMEVVTSSLSDLLRGLRNDQSETVTKKCLFGVVGFFSFTQFCHSMLLCSHFKPTDSFVTLEPICEDLYLAVVSVDRLWV